MPRVLSGLDILERTHASAIRHRRCGLVVNAASVNSKLASAVDLLLQASPLEIAALFGPQHGMWGETQDNMVEWESFRDRKTGLPVYSLYGKARQPLPEMLESLDCLIIDLPDVGARYYTFAWTMVLCLQACNEAGIACYVLDRPNPLNGLAVEGPLLDPAYASFVGLYPVPVRHGLTLGELARYCNQESSLGADLTIIPMQGWQRQLWFDETGLPWVMPSPNMPALGTAVVYPGMCLLEGTGLSEGRGTTRPFEIFGAPFIDPQLLVEALRAEHLPGVLSRPLYFIPTFQKHKGRTCGGAQIHVTDRTAFRPLLTAVAILSAVRGLYPDQFTWRKPPYEYEEHKLPIDILAGSARLRLQIEQGCPLDDIAASWKADEEAFLAQRARYLMY